VVGGGLSRAAHIDMAEQAMQRGFNPTPQMRNTLAAHATTTTPSLLAHLERLVAHKVALVVVVAELGQARVQLDHVEVGVDLLAEDLLHLVKVAVMGGDGGGGWKGAEGGLMKDSWACEMMRWWWLLGPKRGARRKRMPQRKQGAARVLERMR